MTQDANHKDALDAILTSEEPLMPSSGFLASVMERVQEEAAAPQIASRPIPFPWKRVLPGYLAAAVALVWILVVALRDLPRIFASLAEPAAPISIVLTRPMQAAAWVVLALGISLLSWLFSRSLVGRTGLL